MYFNLLDERWIPVLWVDGRYERVGIKDALLNAGSIRQIAAGNPMDRIAILRFLLAILYWCKGNPPEGTGVAFDDSFSQEWFAKLDAYRECFNLLGEGTRFYQDHVAQRRQSVTNLIQELPSGNNYWHFRHTTDYENGLCPACCALGLLRLPLFTVSGLPDLKSGINGIPPVYVLPWGDSLLETLCMNWVAHENLGTPTWLQPATSITTGDAVPLLTGLTMLSRRVWLHSFADPPAACIHCGDRGNALIRSCEFQTAGTQENDQWNDPHVVYRKSSPRRSFKTSDLRGAKNFSMDRPYYDLLCQVVMDEKFPTCTVLIVGFATDKALNVDVWERTAIIPAVTSAQSPDAIAQWKKENWRIKDLIGKMIRSADCGSAVIASIRPHVEHSVSANANMLLVGDEASWEYAVNAYRPMMEVLAHSLAPGVTTAAVQRRKDIAGIQPDMRPAKNADKKKGGGR